MSEYEKKAREFLEKVGCELSIEYVGDVEGFPFSNDHMWHRKYECELKKGDLSYRFPFYGSYMDWKNDEDPSEYDILASLEYWCPDSIDDFVAEYGYEVHEWEDVRRIERIYRDVRKMSDAIEAMFSNEELEMLSEIR